MKVALDAADEIYVVDKLGNRAVKLRADATQVELPFPGLNWPEGLTVDNADSVYVTDTLHDRVLRLAAGDTTPIELPFTGLRSPAGVAVDGDRNVYVTDSPEGSGRVFKLPAR